MRYIKESFFSFGRKSEIYKKIVEYLSNNEIYTIQAGIGDKSLLDIFTGWVNFKFLKTDILMKYSDMYFLFSTKKIAAASPIHRTIVSPDVSDIFHLYSIVVEKNRAKQIRYLSNITDVNLITQKIDNFIVEEGKKNQKRNQIDTLSSEISDDYINDCLVDISDLGGDIKIVRTNDYIHIHIKYIAESNSDYIKSFGDSLLTCSSFMKRVKSEFYLNAWINFDPTLIKISIKLDQLI